MRGHTRLCPAGMGVDPAIRESNLGGEILKPVVGDERRDVDCFPPMVMVIRGRLSEIECQPPQSYRHCGLTQLGFDVTTGGFPDFHLTVYRNARAIPVASDTTQ